MSRRLASSTMAWVEIPSRPRAARASSSAISAPASRAGSSPGDGPMSRLTRSMAPSPAARPTASSSNAKMTSYTPAGPAALVLPRVVRAPTQRCSSRATCSTTCPIQVPSRSRDRNPPGRPSEQPCSANPGNAATRRSLRPGIRAVGEASSSPRSSRRWTTGRRDHRLGPCSTRPLSFSTDPDGMGGPVRDLDADGAGSWRPPWSAAATGRSGPLQSRDNLGRRRLSQVLVRAGGRRG